MNARVVGGRAAMLIAALLPAACMENIVLDHAPIDGGHGDDADAAADGSDNDATSGGDGSTDHGLRCVGGGSLMSLNSDQNPPTIVIAFDRANSMSNRLGPSGSTRFSVTRTAIEDVLDSYVSVVQFGYVEFPGNPNNNCSNNCCASDLGFLVRPGGSLSGIKNALHSCTSQSQLNCLNSDERPIAQAIGRIANASLPKNNTSLYVLLLTDGEPTCQTSSSSDPPCSQAIRAIGDARFPPSPSLPISTFVVGVGESFAANSCLNDLAMAGGVPRIDPLNPFLYYYPATTDVLVHSYVESIVTGAVCQIDITQDSFDRDRVEVDFNGTIPHDPTNQNGWNFVDPSKKQIQIFGPACAKFISNLNSSHQLLVKGCPDPRP